MGRAKMPRVPLATLTRIQVSRVLGRSVATVRRIEGALLFPRCDARGTWRFNTAKVYELAEQVRRGKSLSAAMRPTTRKSAVLWPVAKRLELELELAAILDDIFRLRPRVVELIRASAKRRKR